MNTARLIRDADAEPEGDVMNNFKRFTICKLAGHSWVRIAYPPGADGEASGVFLCCGRCGKEDHKAGTVARGAGGPMFP